MPRFRKKPVVIEAVQLTWGNWSEVCDFVPKPWFVRGVWLDEEGKPLPEGQTRFADGEGNLGLLMQTLESEQFLATGGDWIIKGVKGEFYPCKPDIFAATYEAAREPYCICCRSANVTLCQNSIARWVQCNNERCGMSHHVSMHPELAQFFETPVWGGKVLMLQRLFDLARAQLSNQFISGGLLLMFTGSVIAFARNLPNKIWGHIKNQFIVEVEIASSDPLFDWITLWLNDQPYSKRTRRLIATTVPSYEGGDCVPTKQLCADDTPKPKLILSPARGQHFFLWGGRLLWLSRGNVGENATEGGGGPSNSSRRNSRWNLENYSVRVFGRKQDVLRQLMDLVIDRAVKFQEKKISAFVGIYGDWRRLHTFTPRKLDSVILPSGVTEAIMADLHAFIAAKNWYIDLGIPYHHGYLFHGTPGSGKTSIIGALAGELRMNLYLLNLANEDLDDERFASMLSSIPPQSFMVLEDVDAALGTHIRREDHKGLTLTGLLNSLDGFMAKDGSIVFMTTNHRELLDPALLRPGRVDMQIEFTEATREQKVRMFQRFYPTAEPDAAEIFADFPDIRTMAEAQQQLLEMRDNPEITTKEERKAMGMRA